MSQIMDNTYGALLIGTLIATFASGMIPLQVILYFQLYPEDSCKLKALVALVLCLDITHTGLLWVNLWYIFIENFGNPYQIDVIPKPLLVPGIVIVGSTVGFIVHLFYLYRIFNLSEHNYWITVPNLLLILGDMCSAIATIARIYRYQTLTQLSASSDAWMVSLMFIFSDAADIGIMVTLCILLRLTRQRSISLNNVIDQLTLYTLEMGSLTAIMSIVIMIVWFMERQTLIFLAIYCSLAKAYTIVLLGSLNTRYQLRRYKDSQNSNGQRTTETVAFQSECTDIPLIPPQIPKIREGSTDIQLNDVYVDVTRRIWSDDLSR